MSAWRKRIISGIQGQLTYVLAIFAMTTLSSGLTVVKSSLFDHVAAGGCHLVSADEAASWLFYEAYKVDG